MPHKPPTDNDANNAWLRSQARRKPPKTVQRDATALIQTEELPWYRRADEPWDWYARFVMYREMPTHDRSLEALGDSLGITKQALSPACTRFDWRARAAAYDQTFRSVQARTQPEAVIGAMLSHHSEMLHTLRLKVAEKVEGVSLEDIGWPDFLALMRLVLKEERLAAALSVDATLLAKLTAKQEGVGGGTTVNVNTQSQVLIVMPDNGRGDSPLPTMRVETIEGGVRQLGSGEEEEEE